MATRKTVLIVNLVLSLFFLMNALTIWSGLSLYPGHWHLIFISGVLGNILWLLLPLILKSHSSHFFRVSRAIFGPLWVFWNLLIFLYSAFMLILGILWVAIFAWKWIPFLDFAQVPSNVFLIILGAICVTGFFQSLFLINVEKVLIRVKNLPPEFAGFKIAMLSDLHVGQFTRLHRLEQFALAAQREKPDLFVVCGDITDDDPHYLPKFLRSLEVLDPYLMAVGVLGNHDVYANPEKTLRVLEDSRLQMLVNEGLEIKRGEASLWLAGVGDQGARRFGKWGSVAPDFDKALEGKPRAAATVLLCHQPQGFKDAVERRVELTLSGHTHAGQFGFRFLNWSLAKPFFKYHLGHFQEGESQLYVTAGTGHWALPIRLGHWPEVSLIELQPE